MSSAINLLATANDGTALAVTVSGAGLPLLMIPGLGSARRVYDPILPLLGERCRVITYDPRGIGESGITDPPWSMAMLAADAVAVLDAVGVERAAVFGASMGGMVAQHVALEHGKRVNALALAATTPGGAHAQRPDARVGAALMGRGARTPAAAYRLACTVLYSEAFQQQRPDVIEAQIAERGRHPVRGRAFSGQNGAAAAHDTWARLPEITAPTLVIHGERDAVTPVTNASLLAERIPGARLEVLAGHGHLFFHEDPERSAAIVHDFLSATPVLRPWSADER